MKKTIKKTIKNKYFLTGFISPLLVTGLLVYLAWYTLNYIENRDRQIFIDGFETGHLEGLVEGNDNAYDDFYNKLSPNPQVSYLFKKYFPKEEEARIMRAISLAESKGKQTAINKANKNGSVDSGFFQINTIHKMKGETNEQFIKRMHSLEENFKTARKVLDTQGLTAWSVYNNGRYLTYLK